MNIVGRVALTGLVLIIVSCQPKSPLSDVTGNINVLIPKPINSNLSDGAVAEVKYTLEPVQLNDIKVLKEMRGNYAEFFYAPGSNQGTLFGTAPQARYTKSKQGFYIPIDVISSQMATIYFHLQNLIQLNESVDLQAVTRKPYQVGLEVRKTDRDKNYEKNNAFYDGYSDSMLFLPMNSSELSLALNAGVIAHEFFHSIFYKKVLGKLKIANKTIKAENIKTEQDDAELFNLTYVRGLNEGLADFWGWLYTKDKDFMSLSFTGLQNDRSLNLLKAEIGTYQRAIDIQDRVDQALLNSSQTNEILLDYIYIVGTPHARFLRNLVDLESNTSVASQKALYRVEGDEKKWIRVLVDFLDQLSSELAAQPGKTISAARLFEYVGERSKLENLLTQDQCLFVLHYLGDFDEETRVTSGPTGQNITCLKKTNSEYYEITTH